MIKKMLSCILALCMVGSVSLSVSAYEEQTPDSMVTLSSGGIVPMYKNISYVGAGINLTTDNKAICSGSYCLYGKYKSVITVTLMKSANGSSSWTAVESWTRTNTVAAPDGLSKTSTYALNSSYYYCTYTQVQVYDSNNNVIETATCFSNVTHL